VGCHFPGGRKAAFMSNFLPEFPIESKLLWTTANQPSHPDLPHAKRVAEKAYSSNDTSCIEREAQVFKWMP
jgi:hypothetical protein